MSHWPLSVPVSPSLLLTLHCAALHSLTACVDCSVRSRDPVPYTYLTVLHLVYLYFTVHLSNIDPDGTDYLPALPYSGTISYLTPLSRLPTIRQNPNRQHAPYRSPTPKTQRRRNSSSRHLRHHRPESGQVASGIRHHGFGTGAPDLSGLAHRPGPTTTVFAAGPTPAAFHHGSFGR